MGSIGSLAYELSIWIVPLLFAITLHEAAHGYAAMETRRRYRQAPGAHFDQSACATSIRSAPWPCR